MKKLTFERLTLGSWLLLLIVAAPLAIAQNPVASGPPAPTAPPGADPAPPLTPEQLSFLFGQIFGWQMRNSGITNEISLETLDRGIKVGLQGKKPTPEDMRQFSAYLRAAAQAAIARNEAAAKEFLDRNGKAKGVVTTASGLEYKVIKAGDKEAPAIKPTDRVTFEYRGTLTDGTEFDSSAAHGPPAPFPIGNLIKGWQEALALMKPGAKWELFVPPALAYGDRAQEKIPAGSALIFELTILKVDAAPAPASAPVLPPKPAVNPPPNR